MTTLALTLIRSSPPAPDRNPALVYISKLGVGSRRSQATALQNMATLLAPGSDFEAIHWERLRYQHTQAVRAALLDRYAPATVNKHLSALRGVLEQSWRLELMEAEVYQRASDLDSVKGETLPSGRALGGGELRALFEECAKDGGASGARNAALLAVAYGAGLRRAEIVSLDVADFDPETGALRVRGGKGRKDRLVYATNGSRLALKAWLVVRGAEAGPLFLPVNKGGVIGAGRLSTQAVYGLLRRLATRAGVSRFSPHDLRRTFVGDLLDAGADIATVKQLAGHENVDTTARYDRRGEATKRRASELLHVPYVEVG